MKEIIVTATLSALLTVSGSYLVMKSQLNAEQEYWLSRQKHEQRKLHVEKQVQLLETFNDKFLKLDLLTSKMKIDYSRFQADIQLCYEAIAAKLKDYECEADSREIQNLRYEYRKTMYDLTVTLQMLPLYFSSQVVILIPGLEKAISENEEAIETSVVKFDKKKIGREISDYFVADSSSTVEFRAIREKIIKVMLNDIQP